MTADDESICYVGSTYGLARVRSPERGFSGIRRKRFGRLGSAGRFGHKLGHHDFLILPEARQRGNHTGNFGALDRSPVAGIERVFMGGQYEHFVRRDNVLPIRTKARVIGVFAGVEPNRFTPIEVKHEVSYHHAITGKRCNDLARLSQRLLRGRAKRDRLPTGRSAGKWADHIDPPWQAWLILKIETNTEYLLAEPRQALPKHNHASQDDDRPAKGRIMDAARQVRSEWERQLH